MKRFFKYIGFRNEIILKLKQWLIEEESEQTKEKNELKANLKKYE